MLAQSTGHEEVNKIICSDSILRPQDVQVDEKTPAVLGQHKETDAD